MSNEFKVHLICVPQGDGIKLEEFTWEKFQSFLNNLCLRPEIDRIFVEL